MVVLRDVVPSSRTIAAYSPYLLLVQAFARGVPRDAVHDDGSGCDYLDLSAAHDSALYVCSSASDLVHPPSYPGRRNRWTWFSTRRSWYPENWWMNSEERYNPARWNVYAARTAVTGPAWRFTGKSGERGHLSLDPLQLISSTRRALVTGGEESAMSICNLLHFGFCDTFP